MEAHHLIEKRFAERLGIKNTEEMLSVLLDKDVHKKITKELREEIGYRGDIFANDIRTNNATPQEIWNAIKKVYNNDMGQYLKEIFEQIPEKVRSEICY